MANEIRLSTNVNITNGNFKYNRTISKQIDQANVGGGNPGTVSIGTTEETINFGDIATEGLIVMENLDTTNYIQWGFSTGVYGGRMEAGEPAIFRAEPGLTLYVKSNTATCKAYIGCMED